MEGARAILAERRLAPATLPPQPRRGRSPARMMGAGVLGAAVLALGSLAVSRLLERPAAHPRPRHRRAARRLGATASILSLSVATDASLEHYRGAFHNPAMYVAPLMASAMLANSLHLAWRPERLGKAGTSFNALAFATGLTGTGYHLYNVAKRDGGIDWLNLFYGAPVGAPFAIALAGLAGLAASRLLGQESERPMLLGLAAGSVLALGAAIGLAGTVAEVALLHFRGAYHNPFMYVPVSLPPLAAAGLCVSIASPSARRATRGLLRATALMGLAGVGFHTYGVSRNMGGFYNWTQNLLNGPPLPAPPAFTGVAIAGLAALDLMEQA